MDDSAAQQEELAVIESIYPEMINFEGEKRIKFTFPNSIRLTVELPPQYPSSEPPVFELSGPTLSTNERQELLNLLNDAYIENIGLPVLFSWISIINDFVQSVPDETETEEPISEDSQSSQSTETSTPNNEKSLKIYHGDVFSDRKSHFQAHLCRITTKEEVDDVMNDLLSSNKIAKATHNMYAWRVKTIKDGKELRMHDCFDDGETGASSKMLDLLDKMNAENVLVVVTRWYGGIHLGPDRFRHINNLTREIVAAHGLDSRTQK